MMDAAVSHMNETNELSCVVIPTSGQYLLLPNVCVAEIMPWRRIKVLEDGPAWCLGYMGWRGLTLPVVQYAGFADDDASVQAPRCLVVMNRARTNQGVEFYALVADALPRMVQLVEEDLETQSGNLGTADAMIVSFGTEMATIPDLEYIEKQVASFINGFKG